MKELKIKKWCEQPTTSYIKWNPNDELEFVLGDIWDLVFVLYGNCKWDTFKKRYLEWMRGEIDDWIEN